VVNFFPLILVAAWCMFGAFSRVFPGFFHIFSETIAHPLPRSSIQNNNKTKFFPV
jgi:hypothetical protein